MNDMQRKRQQRADKRAQQADELKECGLNIHWFPGHMAKTRRVIEENLKLIDVMVEMTDARIPESGRNPLLAQVAGSKPCVLLLNKRDYADSAATKLWLDYYRKQGITALACDCRSGAGLEKLPALLKQAAGTRKYGGAIRVMAAGIPNSGKSSFINRMAGGKKAAVGDRPGVTRGKQWIAVKVAGKSGAELEILDLPGILTPKLEDKQAALNLAYTGAVKDEVMDVHALAASLGEVLAEHHADKLAARYNLTSVEPVGTDLLKAIAKARSMVIAGGELDTERAALALLDDFRGCRIGKITLEF
ncbi:MAG: ribosome biogenesis GTPase YlqF, partial [Oscillospiraceae bacterium]|nr:ribosome biogenesis GTPase YlqF [Oscillospiraceae bacterium]